MQFELAGIPIIVDLDPPTEEELQEADESYNAFFQHGWDNSPEQDEFEDAMLEAGFHPAYDPTTKQFVFTPYTPARWVETE